MPVGKGDADPDQEVARRAKPLAERTRPARREQTANRVAGRVERIEGKELARLPELGLQHLQRDSRLDAPHQFRLVRLEHAVETVRVTLDVTSTGRTAHARGR